MQPTLFNFRMTPLSNVRFSRFSLRILRPASMLCLALSLPHCILAQTSRGTLIAVNQADADISIVDPEAGKEVARVPEGAVAGHEVAASLDGKTAYVPVYGNSSVGEPGTDGREFWPRCPSAWHPDESTGWLLYVTTELDRTVTIVDPKAFKIVGVIPTGQDRSHMLVVSHDGRFGYTANVGSGSVSVLDLKARKLVCVIEVSGEVQRISIIQ